MEIRSITLFGNSDLPPTLAGRFFTTAHTAFAYPVQSTRLALPPFPDWWPTDPTATGIPAMAHKLAQTWQAAGINYLSLGPVQLHHAPEWLQAIPPLLSATDMLFASAEIADTAGLIDIGRCGQVADLIRQISQILPHGFGNLYLAALANCPPGSPFFPVAYHDGGGPTFALAIQAADLALDALRGAQNLPTARAALIQAIEMTAERMMETAVSLTHTYDIPCHGLDFSLAPFPHDSQSLGAALEALGLPFVGASGSLFAAGFITTAIQQARFPRCGFSGLMLPVLEDSILAQRAAAGLLTIPDLLSYSAVCGVGLDTLPLPGDTSTARLTGILLDVAMLATRLRKPLTARLMPLPGLQAGDPVHFDFPYFAPSRVMSISGEIGGLLATPARLPFLPIN